MRDVEKECSWMYKTTHHAEETYLFQANNEGTINYVVWSDVFICPNCGSEIVFWDSAVDIDNGKVHDRFRCKCCGVEIKKAQCEHAQEMSFDERLNETITISKQIPVLINYSFAGKRFEKKPDQNDMEIISKIEKHIFPIGIQLIEFQKEIKLLMQQSLELHMHTCSTQRGLFMY